MAWIEASTGHLTKALSAAGCASGGSGRRGRCTALGVGSGIAPPLRNRLARDEAGPTRAACV